MEIDESGVEELQKTLESNRTLAEELASAFDSAREAVSSFFSQLSASTLPTGELSPYQRLMELSEEGFSFELEMDTAEAEAQLDAFMENARQLFDGTQFPLNADAAPALSMAEETIEQLQALFDATFFPLNADAENTLSVGESALSELMQQFSSTLLPLNADASGVISTGQAALRQLQALYSSTTLTLNVKEVKTTSTIPAGSGTSGNNASGSPLQTLLKADTGGRFDRPTATEIAEDGDPEYVIPVKKESVALPLLQQLIGELSDSARETLRTGFSGKSDRGDALSGLPDLLSSAPAAVAPVINESTSQSVQAPVSIQVTAAASDPEAVGRSVYDVAEQYLLRTLQSALG